MTLGTVFFIIAAVLAFLDGFGFAWGSPKLLSLAVAFLALGHLFGGYILHTH